MSPRLSRLLLLAYPPSWRQRYASELQALLEAERPSGPTVVATSRVVFNVLANGAGEWMRAAWRADGRIPMARTALSLAIVGAAFIYVSTMTSLSYGVWLYLNGAFGLLVMGATFARGVKAGWRSGFATGVISVAVFVLLLIAWVSLAGERLVQLPFDHFDVATRGSVTAYLAGPGLGEFAGGAVLGGLLGVAMAAIMAWAGAATARLPRRIV